MSYDCSIKKRKGCNYCLKFKSIQVNKKDRINIDDEEKALIINLLDGIRINFCLICGREFKNDI